MAARRPKSFSCRVRSLVDAGRRAERYLRGIARPNGLGQRPRREQPENAGRMPGRPPAMRRIESDFGQLARSWTLERPRLRRSARPLNRNFDHCPFIWRVSAAAHPEKALVAQTLR